MTPSPDRVAESIPLAIIRLLRWDKPAGRLILMIPALWALCAVARSLHRWPPLDLTLAIVLGSIATSAAGCVVNDLWDRNIDPLVERTKTRPLAARSLSVGVGLAVLVVAALCALAIASYLNPFSFGLCVAAVPVIAIYPACKRFFPVPQLVLAIAWGFAVLIPWAALAGRLDGAAWLLWGATVAWTLGFDTVYALSDREDDLRLGVRSSAIFFGNYAPHAIGAFYALALALLVAFGQAIPLGWPYWAACAIAAGVWARQTWQLLQPEVPRALYPKLFGQNVWVGFVLLAGELAAGFAPSLPV